MDEYIERGKIGLTDFEIILCNGDYKEALKMLLDKISSLPAADVRPVVKAAWKRIDYKPYGHDYECSTCGWKNDMATHFCPNCGARIEES